VRIHHQIPGKKSFFAQAALFLCLLFLLTACSNAGVLSSGAWKVSGLQQNQVRILAVDQTEPSKIFAGDAQGHIFVSNDSGQRWSEHSSGLPLPNAIAALSLDIPGQKLYASTEKGLFTSTDTVEHWNPVKGLPAGPTTDILFDPRNRQTLYVGTEQHGLFVSKDGANTWQAAGSGLPDKSTILDLALDPVQRHLWVITSNPAGVYRSENQGMSWQGYQNGLPGDAAVQTLQPASVSGGPQGLIYLGTNKGIFLSQDSGAHWTRGEVPLFNTEVYTILVDFRKKDTSTVFIGTDLGALRSDDRGQTWQNVASGLPKDQGAFSLALGAEDYTQLFVAAGKVYQFPGPNGGIDPGRIVPLILIVFGFYLLYRFTRRTQGSKRDTTIPEQPASPASLPESKKPT
jgi:ligand-binding sensor domain-containing protein